MAMKRGRRVIPEDIKEKAIAKVKAGERRVDVAKELGVSLPTINNWLATASGAGRSRGTRKKAGKTDELELLRIENDYLKKKIAYLESRS